MIWNFSQRHKLHYLLPALYGVLLLITDHLISKLCPLFFVSQMKEDGFDLFLYCLYLKEVIFLFLRQHKITLFVYLLIKQ